MTALSIHLREELNSGDILVFLTGQEEINLFIEQFHQMAAGKVSRLIMYVREESFALSPLSAVLRKSCCGQTNENF